MPHGHSRDPIALLRYPRLAIPLPRRVERRLKNLPDTACALLLFVPLAALAWWKPLLSGRALFYDVLYKLFLPNQEFLRQSIRSGTFPLWNPYIYSGVPFAANMQSAVFYPFTYVYLLLDYRWMLVFNTVAHTALAGIFMYLFARELGRSRTGAVVSGLAYSLNGNFLLRYAFPSHFNSYVWLPLLLLACAKRDLKLWKAWLLGGIAISLQLFAGHPQFLLYGLVISGLCAVFAEDRKRWISVLIGAGAVSAALAAIQLVPTILLSRESVRAAAFRAPGLDYGWAMANSIHPWDFLVMLIAPQWNAYFTPSVGDPHIVGFYFGPVLLLCAALAFRARSAAWRCSAALLVLGTLLSLGRYFPLYPMLYRCLPPLRDFRFPSQAMYLVCVAVAVLAGIGVDLGPRSFRRWIPILALIDLLFFAWRGNVTINPVVYTSAPLDVPPLEADLGTSRFMLTPRTRYQLKMVGSDETNAWLRFKNSFYPNFSMLYGLPAADGQEELRYGRYEWILDAIDQDPMSPWIDLFSVKDILTYWDMPVKYKLAAHTATVNVFHNPSALPRSYVAHDSIIVADADVIDYVRRHRTDELRRTVILPDRESPERSTAPCSDAGARSTITQDGAQSVAITAESRCPGWLVLADAYDPGWRATVNGAPASVARVNLMQRAVRIPAGKSLIEFRYWPEWFVPVAAISGVGWVAATVLLVI